MIYTCKACGFSEGRRIRPSTACGMLLIVYMGLAFAPLLTIMRLIFPEGLGWWWLLGGPALFATSLIMSFFIGFCVELIEWLLFCCRKCSICGKRKWSWGYTQGFGL